MRPLAISFDFSLDDPETTYIESKRTNDEALLLSPGQISNGSTGVPAGQRGELDNALTRVIRHVEEMYAGGRDYLAGYDMDDSMIDSEDEFTLNSFNVGPSVVAANGTFFINQGPMKTIEKEQESMQIPPGASSDRRKALNLAAADRLEPVVELELAKLQTTLRGIEDQESIVVHGKINPSVLPILGEIAYSAMKIHTKGHLSLDVIRRVCDILGNSAKFSTVQVKMKVYAKKVRYEEELKEMRHVEQNLFRKIKKHVNKKVAVLQSILKEIGKGETNTEEKGEKNATTDENEKGDKKSTVPKWEWDTRTRIAITRIADGRRAYVAKSNKFYEFLEDKLPKELGEMKKLKTQSQTSKLYRRISNLWPPNWMPNTKISGIISAERRKEAAALAEKEKILAEAAAAAAAAAAVASSANQVNEELQSAEVNTNHNSMSSIQESAPPATIVVIDGGSTHEIPLPPSVTSPEELAARARRKSEREDRRRRKKLKSQRKEKGAKSRIDEVAKRELTALLFADDDDGEDPSTPRKRPRNNSDSVVSGSSNPAPTKKMKRITPTAVSPSPFSESMVAGTFSFNQ